MQIAAALRGGSYNVNLKFFKSAKMSAHLMLLDISFGLMEKATSQEDPKIQILLLALPMMTSLLGTVAGAELLKSPIPQSICLESNL